MGVLFEDQGFFWVPEVYRKAERAKPSDKAPKVLPPIPETGWEPKEIFPDLSAAKAIALDTETCDPELREKGPGVRRGAYIAGVSVATDDFSAYYPVAHSLGKNLDKHKVFAWLREQLARSNQCKVGAHLLYDLDFLSAENIQVAGLLFDVQYAAPLLDEYQRSYSLEAIAQNELGEGKETSLLYEWCADAYGGEPDGSQRRNIWRAPSELVGPYAIQDAKLPLNILRKQWEKLRKDELLDIFKMECALIPLLLQMRKRGVTLDLAYTAALEAELDAIIEELRKDVGINVYAAADLEQLCLKEGIEFPRTPPSERFPEGQPSFVKDWLTKHTHPALRKVADLRKAYKLRDTFIRGALLGNQVAGRIHCEFNPLRSDDYGTVSGRFSSSNPNLQQIPARDKIWGPKVRACFVPPHPDLLWMKNDLSQIEFRLGVHFGVGEGIEEVRAQYCNDLHTDFYNLVVSITGLERDPSKAISLGTLYGMGVKKFARMTNRSLEEAERLFAQFNDKLPFMRATYDALGKEAEKAGYITTIGGRRCHLDGDKAHKALNRKLQGSCADWIKRSMLDAYNAGIFDVLELYLTVHDELDTGVPRTKAGVEAVIELHRCMTTAYPLSVPVLAGIDLGANWAKLIKHEPDKNELQKVILNERKDKSNG